MKIPTGPRTWFNDQTGTRTVALGGGALPINYKADDSEGGDWRRIALQWDENLGEYSASQSYHRAQIDTDGAAEFMWPAAGRRRALRLRPNRLVKVDIASRSWTTLAVASPPSAIEQRGASLWMRDIYPGIDRRLRFFNNSISDGVAFNQSARDALAGAGPWAGKMIGTVSHVDLGDLPNAVLRDRLGAALSIDAQGRISTEVVHIESDGTRLLSLAGGSRLYLYTQQNGRVETPLVPVHNYLAFRAGQLFLVELFDPMVVAGWQDGTITHDAEFGNNSTETNLSSLKGIVNGLVDSPSTNGTADSIWVWQEIAGFPLNEGVTCALYDYNAGDEEYIDKTAERKWTIPPSYTDEFKEYTFSGGPSLSSGTTYCIVAWGQEHASHSIDTRVTSGGGASGNFRWVTNTTNYDPGTEPWPEPMDTDVDNIDVAIYCEYTEDAATGPPLGSLASLGVGR